MTPLTDRRALMAHRARALEAARAGGPDPFFLHREAADALQERLEEVNRRFTAPAVVSGLPGLWREILGRTGAVARHILDEPVLDLAPEAHDLVIHALALHWADDPVGQIVQCRRALRPDGLFLGVLFGGESLSGLRAAMAEAEARLTGGLSPRVAPMGEIRDLGALLQRAGLALPVADADRRVVSHPSALHLMRDLRAMGEANALQARHRRIPPRALFAEAARLYEAAQGDGAGRVIARVEMIHLAGWAPHESQQTPLRPGSAAQRLADALGAAERPLPRKG